MGATVVHIDSAVYPVELRQGPPGIAPHMGGNAGGHTRLLPGSQFHSGRVIIHFPFEEAEVASAGVDGPAGDGRFFEELESLSGRDLKIKPAWRPPKAE